MSFERAWAIVKSDAEDYVDEVRSLVEEGMPVMEAVQTVCRLVGCKGRDLMRAYVEAYR